MIHILKLNINWKPAKIPYLINMLYNEINLQEALIRGALNSRGDYELSDEAACLKFHYPHAKKNQRQKKPFYIKDF